VQMNALFQPVMELFNKSGSHTTDFRTYNKGDYSSLHVCHV